MRYLRPAALVLFMFAATPALGGWTADLADARPRDMSDARFFLRLEHVRTTAAGRRGDMVVVLVRRDGKWVEKAHDAAADYNQVSDNEVRLGGDFALRDGKLVGTAHVTIHPDRPRPLHSHLGPHAKPKTEDVYEVTLEATIGAEPAAYQPDRNPSQPHYRKDVPEYAGRALAGTFTAVREDTTTKGVVSGAVAPLAVPGRLGTESRAFIHDGEDGEPLTATARLSRVRVQPPEAGWVELRLSEPVDWSAYEGLRLEVSGPKDRNDATVGLALQVGEQWKQVTTAAVIRQTAQTWEVPFEDFGLTRRPEAVRAVRIGADNPLGVGDVTFSVHRLGTYGEADPDIGPRPVTITLDPDAVVSLGGTDTVPKGLFGHHDVGHSKPRKPREGEPSPTEYLRIINPGMLRPLDHVGFGGKALGEEEIEKRLATKAKPAGTFYERAKAASAVDRILWCHTQDLFSRPSWMDQGIEKLEGGVERFYLNLASRGWTPGDEHNLIRRLEVWNEPFFWGRHVNEGPLQPAGKKAWVDPTQHGCIPAELGAEMYARVFKAAKRGRDAANPHVKLGGPCCPSMNADDYSVLENYVARWLDRCAEDVDFLTEHHYGGPPAVYTASYDVATAYTDVVHGRRIPIYNTEANNLGTTDAGKAAYNVADILHCVIDARDKVKGRALHALWNGYLRSQGELHAYTLLAPLRGKVLDAASDADDVLVCASLPAEGQVVVVVHNTAFTGRPVKMPLPEGFEVAGADLLWAAGDEGKLDLRDPEGRPIAKPAGGKTTLRPVKVAADEDVAFALPARSTLRLTLTRPGFEPPRVRTLRQHFVDPALARVAPGKAVVGKVVWRDADHGQPIKRAWLRLVTRDVHRGEAMARIGGQAVALPWSSSNDYRAVIQDVPLDPDLLGPDTKVRFEVTDAARFNGFTVYAASVLVER